MTKKNQKTPVEKGQGLDNFDEKLPPDPKEESNDKPKGQKMEGGNDKNGQRYG